MRTDILEQKENILNWIKQNKSKAFICKELKCKPETLNHYLEILNIEYNGNQSGKGISKDSGKYMPLKDYLLNSQDV